MISTSNPKFYKKLVKATSRLVHCLTDFEESSENHEICKAYTLSQLQNHRFLDVDSHKVDRWLKGLYEKFVIHSQPKKAEILQDLKLKFLESDISDSSKSRSQIHYSMLSILLNLSDNPVNVEYVPPLPAPSNEEECFDWAKYLLEGEEMPRPTQWACGDTPDGSDSEEEICSQDVVEKEGHYTSPIISAAGHEDGISEACLLTGVNLVPQYWAPLQPETHGVHFNSASGTRLNEMHIIREVLWLLAGGEDLYLFPLKNGKHEVCERSFSFLAVTNQFKAALMKVTKYGDIVKTILCFIFTRSQQECQTYQAFAEALLGYMNSFRTHLKDLENRVMLHKETLLFGDIIQILSSRFIDLSTIATVLNDSVMLDENGDSNSKKSSRLLSVLYNSVLHQTNASFLSGSELLNTLIQLWIAALRPYFQIMDRWMTSGTLLDPHQEFVLRKSVTCPDAKSDAFWSESFSLESKECVKYMSWLKPALRNIALCGKSVEVLVSLGKSVKSADSASLHERFIQTLLTTSYDRASSGNEPVSVENVAAACDGMMRLNFEQLFSVKQQEKSGLTFHFEGHSCFQVLIHSTISRLVQGKSNIASCALLNIFLDDYDLVGTLRCFHKFHLLEWGDVMYDFSTAIFEKISCGEYWTDLMSLRALLQEAISNSDPEADFSFVAVSLNKEKQKSLGTGMQLIRVTDIIELTFEIKWPLNIVITEKSKILYNTIFSYLLQVKRALFCLEHLKFDTIYMKATGKNHQMAHKLSLLRAKLLRLVSHWHNFVMTNVIQSEKETFMNGIKNACDIDGVILVHEKFLDHIMSMCLLKDERQSEKMIQGTLRKVFDLCIAVHTKWNRVQNVSQESLRKLESDYKECSEFLGVILRNLVSRGTVPLSLEALAFCLTS